jgi:hypothetical protein
LVSIRELPLPFVGDCRLGVIVGFPTGEIP